MRTNKIEQVFHSQKQYKLTLKLSSASERKRKLKDLDRTVIKYRKELQEGVYADFRKSATEVDVTEILTTLSEIRFLRKKLGFWMRDKEVPTIPTLFGTSSRIIYEPKGNVLIISPWNYPINLTLIPLAGAIAAGNTAVIKPSEFTPNTNAVIKRLLAEVFDENEVCFIEGAVETSQQLLALPFDHIFFTGSPAVGKIVKTAAAKNLSSITLELGGKSPNIVDETADIDTAAIRIVWSKFLNNGQICIAPDYILVHHNKKEELIKALKKQIKLQFGKNGDSKSLCSIISEKHLNRLSDMLDEAVQLGAKVDFGGQMHPDEINMSPTILSDINMNSRVMKEEIFGPILPVVTYKDINDVIKYMNDREKPLTLYIYSKSKANTNKILRETSSGNIVINHALINFSNPHLPFGGVNHSGFGKAHGKFSFLSFSNQKAVVRQWSPVSISTFLRQPFTKWTKKIVDLLIKWV